MVRMFRAAAARASGLLLCVQMAAAQAPLAVVEDVQGHPSGVEFMDYVAPGKVIRLGAGDAIVLGYIKSCLRETITGGTVTVGAEASDVAAGKVERVKVECDASHMKLTPQQAAKSGVMVFRDRRKPSDSPELTLYGTSPLIEAPGGGALVIERIDQRGERYAVTIGATQLLRGAFYDFAKSGQQLAPGGTYRARIGERQIVFKIDGFAKPGPAPIIGRLLRFPPAG